MIAGFDHLVLTVRDPEATCAFYEQALGMRTQRAENGRLALHFGSQKINLHQAGAEIAPHAACPQPGSADFCLVSAVPLDQVLERVRTALSRLGREILLGPVERNGARGPMLSFYFRDPDDNLIEICWYVPKKGMVCYSA
ncbi:MAG: VOC family protein [Desulfovibrio sp.]